MNHTSTTMFDVACEYIKMGWALIPVEGLRSLDTGECLCGAYPCGVGNSGAGKHPASGRMGWQKGPAMTSQDAYHIFEEECPDYNLGARTGEISGFFALDVEAHGIAELEELEAIHGKLPRTRVHRTGAGGRHHLFNMPDFEVRNSQKKLGKAIDIRGTGGMIVLPPSVSGKGAYGVEDDAPIVDAPQWLLDWLRSLLREKFDPGQMSPAEDLPAYSDLEPERQTHCQRYALAVIEREAKKYASAPPETGSEALFNATCNILEIVQSPWNLYTYQDALTHLEQARKTRIALNPGRGQTEDEFKKTFMSARSTTVGKGRPLPPDKSALLTMDVVMPPPLAGAGSGEKQTAAGDDDPFADPVGGIDDSPAEPVFVAPPRPSALERLRAHMHNRIQLNDIAPPTPLIERVMDVGTMVVLSGAFGTFKTFVTIGWACSIATGTPWLGHEVATPGPVLYIAAEGASGIKLRVAAWEKEHGVVVPPEMLTVIDIPVNLGNDAEVTAAVIIAKELGAKLIIFDTLHRCTGGMDGDSNTEMGRITQVADIMREHADNITTLFVHHTGHAGSRSRGASSIEDDADCVWIAKLTNGDTRDPTKPRALEQRKTKDSPLLDPFYVKFEPMEDTESGVMRLVDEYGMPLELEVAGDSPFADPSNSRIDAAELRERIEGEITGNAGLVLNVFADVFKEHASGVTEAKVRAVCKEAYKDRHGWYASSFHRTFGRAWGRLEKEGAIENNGNGRWIMVPADERLRS